MFGSLPKPLTFLSLFPITYGVAHASTLGNLSIATMKKELTSTAAILAMASNFAFAIRSGLRKKLPADFKHINSEAELENVDFRTFTGKLVSCLTLGSYTVHNNVVPGTAHIVALPPAAFWNLMTGTPSRPNPDFGAPAFHNADGLSPIRLRRSRSGFQSPINLPPQDHVGDDIALTDDEEVEESLGPSPLFQ
ncbi:unnamed protein product [Sphagnum balticum]